MYEWNEAIQKMINWIEDNITDNPTLLKMSEQIGYSPYYCSSRFHEVVGMTMKSYMAGRRLARAPIEIRDTRERILDIAVRYGYSSQEALTRAFVNTYGCTPSVYRKNPRPLNIPRRHVVFFPEQYRQLYGENVNEAERRNVMANANIRVEYVPAHKYIGIWEEKAFGYGDFWKYHGCDDVCGVIESMRNVADPVIGCHTAGWYQVNGERRYFYGLGVPADYAGPVPEGFEIKECPGSYYLVFYHPAFDFLKDNGEVMPKVEQLAWNYDIEKYGLTDEAAEYIDKRSMYQWNEEECQCYQRHCPETIGYEVLRPIIRTDAKKQ